MLLTSTMLLAAMLSPIVAGSGTADFPADLEKWIVLAAPEAGSEAWDVANGDVKHEWNVTLDSGRPRAELRKKAADTPAPLPFEIAKGTSKEGLYGRRSSVKVGDGWIVAFNAGEFGAGLWWFSADGKRRDKISEAWVNGFIESDAGLLALVGISHGRSFTGRIVRLARGPGGRWQSEDLVDLNHAPEVALKRADGSLLVATTDRLLRVVPSEKKVEILLKDAFWRGLYPNSIVVTPNGTTYLGMRHGVARVENVEGTNKVSWLLPNKAFAEMKSPEGFH